MPHGANPMSAHTIFIYSFTDANASALCHLCQRRRENVVESLVEKYVKSSDRNAE